MSVYHSLRAIAGASGESIIDWEAVAEAAKASMAPGELSLSSGQQQGYADDVREARLAIQDVADIAFQLPDTIEIQNRHHWVDANIAMFQRVIQPLEEKTTAQVPELARIVNTGSMSVTLGFLGRNVLGQYDPLLLADAPQDEHGLYFVHPNIVTAADELDVDFERFRRWIAFHEVTHAAEFGQAPWLPDYLVTQMERGIDSLSQGSLDRDAFVELQTTMTVVEGYAELLMDEAFDDEYETLRQKLEQRREGAGPVSALLRRLLGIRMKQQQYERGRAFFDAVVEQTDLRTATSVWDHPDRLPTAAELDQPTAWIDRVVTGQ